MDGELPNAHEIDAVRLPGWSRVVLGAVVGWHLLAVVVAPASVAPASPLVLNAWEVTSPYTRALYLNHGYRFFAPDPPDVSMLLVFDVEPLPETPKPGALPGPTETPVVVGKPENSATRLVIPTPDIWPRLLYHRHFMISEQLVTVPQARFEPWVEAMCRHAMRERGFDRGRVFVTRIYHGRPSMPAIVNGYELDDPTSYRSEPLGVFDFDESTTGGADRGAGDDE